MESGDIQLTTMASSNSTHNEAPQGEWEVDTKTWPTKEELIGIFKDGRDAKVVHQQTLQPFRLL